MSGKTDEIDPAAGPSRTQWLFRILRYGLPAVVAIGGIVVMLGGSESDLEGGAGIISAGLAIWATNWLVRASIDSDEVRDQEQQAREYFSRHGYWPGEAPSH